MDELQNELLGRTISHYRVISLLGSGGMGVVYRGHDARLGRDVALKVLPLVMMGDETARSRLQTEARTASQLNHPHIAHIYDVGEDGGHLFIAMELIEGQPLRDLIPNGGLPLPLVLLYGKQIADALAFAHESGVIHRDLKTANVMVTPEGRVKVLDFGLAKRIQEAELGAKKDLGLTASGMVVGTPNYLPPEILLGAKAEVRSDIWSLGVMLYEMASGRLPFEASSMAQLTGAILNEPPTPLSARLPTGLQMVIARCLEKDPAERYRTASEVRAALEGLDRSTGPPRARKPTRRVWVAVAGALITVLAVTLALHTADIQKWVAGGATGSGTDRPRIGSLAVLPLANLSGDPTQEYFADGMTEELITNLALIHSLKVISRTSVMPFKQSKKSVRDIASQLGVDAIVEGSVQRAGDKVRISAQLIDPAKDHQLWAKSYERQVKDVLSLQSEVARDIVSEIKLQLSPQEIALISKKKTVNPEAYEMYLRGRYEWSKVNDEGVRKAIEYYQKAIALNPGDARYSSGLADAYLLQTWVLGTLRQKEGMAKVKEYAQRALAADDSAAEAHSSMAIALFFEDWNWSEAERHANRAIQLNPGYSTAHLVYSVMLAAAGRVNEAIEQDRLAMDLDPLSLVVSWNASATLFYAKRYDDAIVRANRGVELDPTSTLPLGRLARIQEAIGNYDASLDILKKILPQKNIPIVAMLRQAYATGGANGYWRKMLEIETTGGEANAKDPIRIAMCYTKLGQRDKAIAALERAIAQHSGDMVFLRVEPSFDPLHGDPRFQSIVKRVGIPPA